MNADLRVVTPNPELPLAITLRGNMSKGSEEPAGEKISHITSHTPTMIITRMYTVGTSILLLIPPILYCTLGYHASNINNF